VHSEEYVDSVLNGSCFSAYLGAGDTQDGQALEATTKAALMAVGCVVDGSIAVSNGSSRNSLVIVRPSSHAARATTFAFPSVFANVAIAAKTLVRSHQANRVLIVNWGACQGSNLQEIFRFDENVLVISVHQAHPDAAGQIEDLSAEGVAGHGINIPFPAHNDITYGDSEFLGAFYSIVIPVGQAFRPDVVILAAGFHTWGSQINVSPSGYAHLTKLLMQLAGGKLVFVLDGTDNPEMLTPNVEGCLHALLGDKLPDLNDASKPPNATAVQVFEDVMRTHSKTWHMLDNALEYIQYSPAAHGEVASDAEKSAWNATLALASLSMAHVKA
jgi:histone deacetylase 4/5